MTRKSLLMLSDDAAAVRACAELDVDVTVVIGSNQRDWGEVEIPSGTRQLFVESRSHNMEGVLLRMHRAGLSDSSFDAVYTSDELAIVAASTLGAALGSSSLPLSVAARFRDKSLQKSALRDAGIPTANFVVLEDLSDLPEDYSVPFERAVLKPIAGGATEDTCVIRSDEDLQAAAARLRRQHWGGRQQRTFLLEEFVAGQEWHLDGVVYNGALQFISVGSYRVPCLSAVSSNEPLATILFDPVADAEVYDLAVPMAEKCLQTLGLEAGVFHMELFYEEDSGTLTFGECGARRGGGLIQEEIHYKYGVNLAESAIRCALGMDPEISVTARPDVVGSVYLPYIPGTLVSHPSKHEVENLENVEHVHIELAHGYVMRPGCDTTLKIGQVMLAADSRERLLQRADEVVKWFTDRTVVIPADSSPAQLRAWHKSREPQI